jgi:ABC-2 type transport system permease protein
MAAGNSSMIPVQGAGWSRGLENTLRGELKGWFATSRWWRQIIIWTACVNLIFLIVAATTPAARSDLSTTLLLFNIFMGLTGPVGVSIVMQSTVVGEKRAGTAAWVLSKPVSRAAFLLSKLIAHTTGILVTLVLAQGLIAYAITAFFLKTSLPIPAFIAALGIHLANILFYLTLTLLMGVLFDQSAPVIGIPLAVLFAQNILMSFFPPLAAFVPWTLAIPVSNEQFPSIAMSLMTGARVPTYAPLFTALAASVVFVIIALVVFEKQEL